MNLESLVTKEFLNARLVELEARVDARFAKLEAKVDGNHRVFIWTQAVILAAVIIPYLERLVVV